MIKHLQESKCSICADIAIEFEKLLEKNYVLRTELQGAKILMEKAAEEIENCYGRETQLSERLRKVL